jgi:hypothetical protein
MVLGKGAVIGNAEVIHETQPFTGISSLHELRAQPAEQAEEL